MDLNFKDDFIYFTNHSSDKLIERVSLYNENYDKTLDIIEVRNAICEDAKSSDINKKIKHKTRRMLYFRGSIITYVFCDIEYKGKPQRNIITIKGVNKSQAGRDHQIRAVHFTTKKQLKVENDKTKKFKNRKRELIERELDHIEDDEELYLN